MNGLRRNEESLAFRTANDIGRSEYNRKKFPPAAPWWGLPPQRTLTQNHCGF